MIPPHNEATIFRYPGEWEPQKTIWLTWPENQKEWGHRLKNIREFYVQLIKAILPYQPVSLIISPPAYNLFVSKNHLNDFKYECQFYQFESNDIWIRDYGPLFVEDNNQLQKLINFEFNSYGEKFPPWDKDNQITLKIAKELKLQTIDIPIIIEGGAIELNGKNLLITTEQCLLDKKRNANVNKSDYEKIFKQLRIKDTIWIKNGLKNDHTDGHIDNFIRFINHDNLVICQTTNTQNIQFEVLKEAHNTLLNWNNANNNVLTIHSLPIPENIEFHGETLPASYANFIFLNGAIIVPTFGQNNDQIALDILQELLPNHDINGIDCNLLIQEGGGLHCISKQQPVFSNS